jgi:hypothetical protein
MLVRKNHRRRTVGFDFVTQFLAKSAPVRPHVVAALNAATLADQIDFVLITAVGSDSDMVHAPWRGRVKETLFQQSLTIRRKKILQRSCARLLGSYV